MSYDLWFRAPGSPPTLDELVAYFSAQPHVEVRENQPSTATPTPGSTAPSTSTTGATTGSAPST
ncbi:MAG: hypothetical protein R3F62_12725 [Planctomycetota bacterium]